MIYVSFPKKLKLEIIKHCLEIPCKECDGFIYGNIIKENENIFCDVNGIYYERRYGSDCEFNFGLSYICNAKNQIKQFGSLIGTYHSHGVYPAIFSEVDRKKLQQYFGPNKITMIYSPTYSNFIGEFLNESGESKKVKIFTK